MSLLVTLQKKMEDTEPKPMELRQALPKLNPEGGKPVYEWLIGMIRQREQLGIKRYGQALRTHNGRIAWLDFIHEAVDGLAYLSQHIMETEEYERRGMLNGVRWALKTSQESESPSKAWEAMEWAIERLSSGQNLPD